MADLNSEPYIFRFPAGDSGLSDLATMEHDTNRIKRIDEAWQFYFTKHWTFEREDGEPLVTINYCKALIDKKISFLVGEGFTLNVPAALQNKTLPLLQKVWDNNGRQKLPYEIVQEGSVTGDCFILVTLAPPDNEILRFDPLAKYRIIVQKLNSRECEPVFDETVAPDRYGRKMRLFRMTRHLRRLKKNSLTEFEDVTFKLLITPEFIITKLGDEAEKRSPNLLQEISVVHIQNKASSRTLFGIDDMTDLIPLNREYNEKSTDISDAINYNAHPITVLFGARAKALERGPRAVWSNLPKDAKVELLSLQGDFVAAVNYLDRLKKAMHEISGVPEGSLGMLQPITGTSGDTLHMTYAPLIDERNKKKATYEPGFERVNYFVLRYAEVYQQLKLPMGICEKCGGKIAITYVDDPQDMLLENGSVNPKPEQLEVRRCYVLDPETYDFLDPSKHKVPVIRQHSFGDELTDIPLEQAEEEHGTTSSSFWDLEPEAANNPMSDADLDPSRAVVVPTAGANGTPPSDQTGSPTGDNLTLTTGAEAIAMAQPAHPQLPPGFELPPEPEILDLPLVVVEYDDIKDKDNKPLRITVQKERHKIKAVPVECDQHSFLSPYTNYVTFNDTLPKDRAAQANLFVQYDALKIVSKSWMMSQIGVENIAEMMKAIQEESHTALVTAGSGPKQPFGGGNGPAPPRQKREPGVVRPSQSVMRGVPVALKAGRQHAPGTGSGSNTSTSS